MVVLSLGTQRGVYYDCGANQTRRVLHHAYADGDTLRWCTDTARPHLTADPG